MAPSAIYPTDERSQGNRLQKRTKHDRDHIISLINEAPLLHVSFNAPTRDGPQFPTILPMLGAMGNFGNDDEESVYLHGSSVARLFKITNGEEIPLCICATMLDGYVMSLTPFHNSCNYRCAVLFGHGTIVEDEEEISYALKLITNNTMPARWENSRTPPTKAEVTSTGVVKFRVETASVKTRTGGPNDERSDLQNPAMADNTWVGVVPTYMTLGEPLAAEHNKVQKVPEYIEDWVADANSLNEQKAIDAMDA